MNIKEQRGLELASKSKITNKNGLWFVPSQSGKKGYKVEIKETNQRCDCPDFEFRQITCKHIFAVQFVIQQKETKTEIKDGKTTVTETVVTKRVSYIYAIASDDLLPTSAPRSRLYRVSPTTGLATQIGDPAGITLTTGRGGDQNPYFDGLAILPDGRAFGTEARFTNNPVQSGDPLVADNGGMYRIFLTGPNVGKATFTKYLLPTDVNRDTGLANNGFWYFSCSKMLAFIQPLLMRQHR